MVEEEEEEEIRVMEEESEPATFQLFQTLLCSISSRSLEEKDLKLPGRNFLLAKILSTGEDIVNCKRNLGLLRGLLYHPFAWANRKVEWSSSAPSQYQPELLL